jgi:hypothetical protein
MVDDFRQREGRPKLKATVLQHFPVKLVIARMPEVLDTLGRGKRLNESRCFGSIRR